jgi:hypothetical protein
MQIYRIYANGIYWGDYEGVTDAEAIQACANDVGTCDIGQTEAITDGMTAETIN